MVAFMNGHHTRELTTRSVRLSGTSFGARGMEGRSPLQPQEAVLSSKGRQRALPPLERHPPLPLSSDGGPSMYSSTVFFLIAVPMVLSPTSSLPYLTSYSARMASSSITLAPGPSKSWVVDGRFSSSA